MKHVRNTICLDAIILIQNTHYFLCQVKNGKKKKKKKKKNWIKNKTFAMNEWMMNKKVIIVPYHRDDNKKTYKIWIKGPISKIQFCLSITQLCIT